MNKEKGMQLEGIITAGKWGLALKIKFQLKWEGLKLKKAMLLDEISSRSNLHPFKKKNFTLHFKLVKVITIKIRKLRNVKRGVIK